MEKLNELTSDHFEKLTIFCLDEMTGYIPEVIDNQNEDESSLLKLEVKNILLQAALSADPRGEKKLKILETNKANFLIDQLISRKLDVALNFLKNHNSSVQPCLTNFDWKVKWIVGSSSSSTLKYPILTLDLKTDFLKNDSSKEDIISFDMTKNEVDLLISVLEDSIK